MKFKKDKIDDDEKRTVSGYLWFPKIMDNLDGTKEVTRWLEKATWEEYYSSRTGCWFYERWLDI